MASFSKVRAGVLGISVMILSGCGQDPQLATLQQRVFDLKEQLALATSRQAAATARSEALATQSQALQAELETIKQDRGTQATTAQNALASALADLASTRLELQNTRKRLGMLRSHLDGVTLRAEALAGHLDIEDAHNLSLPILMDRLSEAYGDAQQEARTASQNEIATIKTLTAFAKRLKAADQSRMELTRRLQRVGQMRDAMRDGWRAERARAADSVDALQQRIASLGSQIESQNQTNQSLSARAALLELQRDDHATRLATATEELEAGLAAIPDLEAQIEELRAENEALLAEREADTRELARMSEAQDYLYELFESKSIELGKTSAALKKTNRDAGEMAATLADTAAERDALITERDVLIAERDTLQSELAGVNEEITELKDALTEQELARKRANARARKAAEQASTQLDFVTAELHDALARLDTHVGELQDAQAKLDAKAGELQAARAKLDAQAGELQAARAKLDAQAGELQNALAQLDARAAAQGSANASAPADSAALDTARARAAEAEALLAPMTAQRNELLNMLMAANTRIAALEARLKD